jgi:drug/metabolite transporter (DMT)-like permease
MLGVLMSWFIVASLVKLKICDLPHKNQVTVEFYMKSIIPIGITSAGTIYFGNLAYLYLGVSFVQICKAFGPVITMLVGFGLGTDKPTLPLIGSILLIAGGTSAAVSGELNFSWIGFIVIMLAQLSEGLKLILQQVTMQRAIRYTF